MTSPPSCTWTFFDGRRLGAGLGQGQMCVLEYDLTSASEGQRLGNAWVQLTVPPVEPKVFHGDCSAVGTWGTTPAEWVSENPIEVGVGPIDQETLDKVEGLWRFYGDDWNATWDEIRPDLIAGRLFVDGELNEQWAFGAAYRLDEQGKRVQVDGKDVRIPASELAAGAEGNRFFRLFGRSPRELSVPEPTP